MTTNELRSRYIDFFCSRKHKRIANASLVPEEDPTVLFTTAGMHPLIRYIQGQSHPMGTRLVNVQRCIRTGDIDEVGDDMHLTFFEMLGNWSLGDYFKKESIALSYEFLTSSKYLNIDPLRLSITVFEGEEGIAPDKESAGHWREHAIADKRIFFLGRKHNWWGPPGAVGPCGPDTEIFVERTGYENTTSEHILSNPERYTEIWNNVFMQFYKNAQGDYEPLRLRCVDTGMGLERTAAILQGKHSVFDIEVFAPIMEVVSQLVEKQEYYALSTRATRSAEEQSLLRAMRIIADHMRAAVFILGDEQTTEPSNNGRGYVLRRIIRRAIRYLREYRQNQQLYHLADTIIDTYKDAYPQLAEKKDSIVHSLKEEEKKFLTTLDKGKRMFEKLIETSASKKASKNLGAQKTNTTEDSQRNTHTLSGKNAFYLYETYGFPLELTKEMARERGFDISTQEFEQAAEVHKKKSRTIEHSSKGGLETRTRATTRLHTATHLLHQALRDVLGVHVAQRGSNITEERLRFDFSHPKKCSPEELAKIELIVNEKIGAHLPVSKTTTSLDAAVQSGAIALFTNKYQSEVLVYSIGDYSKEVCGGPHVTNTSELGTFKITKEGSVSSGIRRIRATLTT